ncbi:hypothetical protein [Chakrabartyella piscis]|uniref:hypothetical protein n=1 Tax=Chakrabartyella piscis TaxID=2918914 RepID=UPI002958D779|nr:hypothetical protein [Chakrabartyella piscis]
MAQLTTRQEQYLLLFATVSGVDRTLAGAAKYFEVSKPSAFHIIENLIKEDMLEKQVDKEIIVTPLGLEYIQEKYERGVLFSKWMQTSLRLVPLQAEKEARRLVTILEEETLQAMTKNIRDIAMPKNPTDIDDFSERDLDFHIYKKDLKTLSMGDKGFIKPATLCEMEGEVWLVLRARKLEYRSKKRNLLRGQLSRLWYQYKKRWHEVEIDENGLCYIPFSAAVCNEKKGIGMVTIRARASVGIFTMPEGEAKMIFNLR